MQYNEELVLNVVNSCFNENQENNILNNKIDELTKIINQLMNEKIEIINYIKVLIKEKDDIINQNKIVINQKEETIKYTEILIKQKDEIINQKDNDNFITINNLTRKLNNTEGFNVFLLNMCNTISLSLNKEMQESFNKILTTGYAQLLLNNKGL